MTSAPVDALGLVNADAETAVLYAMRTDMGAAIDLAQKLEPTDFHDSRRAVVFEAIRALLLGVEPIDTSAIVAECRSVIRERKLKIAIDDGYIESLQAGDVRRSQMYGNTVKRLAWLRGAGEFAFWLVQELQARPNPDDLFAAAQERWQQLAPKRESSRFVYGWETLPMHRAEVRKRLDERAAGIRSGYDWPWSSWNAIIRPLQPGFVGILAAPDGMGKSTYLEMVAEHWAKRGYHTVYVHLEDSRTYKFDRRLARHAQVGIDHIQDGTLAPDERQRIDDAEERMDDWAGLLHYYDAAGESMTTILRELESRVSEGVCQAVVFDYLDKVRPTRAQAQLYGGNSWERQADDMEQLKAFAEKSRLAVFTATQGNKSMQEAGTQTRRAIQGSGQKSQKSQLVVILTRDLVGDNGLRDAKGVMLAQPGEYSPVVNVRVDKQNIGKTGSFQQFLQGPYFTVRDIKVVRTEVEG